jgi:hypothetical protein
MKRLVGFAGMLQATSAAAREPGNAILQSATVITPRHAMAGQNSAAGLICETRARRKPVPELEVTITPPTVKIPDNAKRGMRLAKITVRWSNGEPFRGEVRLTKNTAGICQLGTVKLAESRLGKSRVGRVKGRDEDASRPDLRRPSLPR